MVQTVPYFDQASVLWSGYSVSDGILGETVESVG